MAFEVSVSIICLFPSFSGTSAWFAGTTYYITCILHTERRMLLQIHILVLLDAIAYRACLSPRIPEAHYA